MCISRGVGDILVREGGFGEPGGEKKTKKDC